MSSSFDGSGSQDKSDGSGPVRAIVRRLRRKLGDDADNPTYIFNEPRVGYRKPYREY